MKTLIYQLTQRGFCSELNQLLSAKLYCLDQGIEFRLSSRYWGAAFDRGWTDYFEPFCREQNNRLTRIGTITRLPDRIARRQRWYKRLFPGTLYTHDVWEAINHPDFTEKTFDLPEHGIHGGIFTAKQVLLRQIYRLNSETQKTVDLARKDIQTPYIGLHIRRGDKLISEAKLIELDHYVAAIEKLPTECQRFFVATDDYSVVEEFRERFLQYEVLTLCEETQRGYQQSNHNQATREEKRAATLQMLADIDCLASADHFVGTFSSNIGRLIALRTALERCTSLDSTWYEN